MGACGFRSGGNDRQGRRLGGPKVERAHRRVSNAAPCLDCVLRDAVCADVFIRTCGARAGCAESKFAVVFAIHAVHFSLVPICTVWFFSFSSFSGAGTHFCAWCASQRPRAHCIGNCGSRRDGAHRGDFHESLMAHVERRKRQICLAAAASGPLPHRGFAVGLWRILQRN
jgi:hypothetical protein